MVVVDSGIVLDFPDSWDRFTEGSRSVFHTSRREEIIVSASRLDGDDPTADRAHALDRLFANGLEAAKRGSAAPDLRVTKSLAEELGISRFRCATVLAETTAQDAFFGQAVLQHPRGVVFLTYEAPFVNGAAQMFHDLLQRIHET
jgi:hypothetical protein